MKGIKIYLNIDGKEEAVVSYGNLALLNNGKLPLKGKPINSYMIIHLPSRQVVAGPIRGHKDAMSSIESLLAIDEWEFTNPALLGCDRSLKLISRIMDINRHEEAKCRAH